MKQLETRRLLLRAFRREDADDLHEYAKNPKIGPSAGWPAHRDLSETRRYLHGLITADESWAIELEGKVIGSVGLHPDRLWERDRVRMLGYVLSEPYWGAGYATEAARRVLRYAFEEEGLSLVTVYHYSYNSRSGRVAEKCGFIRDGAFRDATLLPDGNSTDEICYSMTPGDYEGLFLGVGQKVML